MAGKKEAKVKVRLDTKQAKADLDGVGVAGRAAAGRVTSKLNASGGRADGGVGRSFALGGALGAGFGMAQSALRSLVGGTLSDVISERFVGVGAGISEGLGGPEARGIRRSREEAKALFSRSGDVEGALSYFNSIKQWRVDEEKTMNEIDQRIGAKTLKETPGGDLSVKIVTEIVNVGDKIIEFLGSIKK